MKRLFTTLLCILLLSTLAMGCQPGADGKAPQGGNVDGKGEPVTITLLTAETESEWNLASTPNFKRLQEIFLEKFNCIYELETALPTEFASVITTRFASGEQLPDMVNHRFEASKLIELYDNGLIIAVNDLLEQYGPNIQKQIDSNPYFLISNGDREGNLLRIPADYQSGPQHRISVLHVRNDWLNAIGTDVDNLKTPDDLYNALKAFQEQDVNGSGKADEMLTSFNTAALNQVMSTAFGIKGMIGNSHESWYFDDANKVYSPFVQPETLEYVTFMNKLYSEKLLDNTYMNQTGELFSEKRANNQIAARVGPWWESVLDSVAMADLGYEPEHVPVMPPLAKDGNPFVYLKSVAGYGGYMVTKDCDAPHVAMQTMDWGYTTLGTIFNYYGEETLEGGNYYKKTVPLEGVTLPEHQMEYTEKGEAEMAEEPQLWAKMGWNLQFSTKTFVETPEAVATEFFSVFTVEKCGRAAEVDFNINKLRAAEDEYGIPACDFVTPTSEQAKEWENFGDLWLYMNEMIEKFITGAEPLSGWDAYVAKCDELGLSRALEIKQDQYDAYVAIIEGLK